MVTYMLLQGLPGRAAGYIVATTGNAYSGLWYTWVIVAFGAIVAWWGLPSGPPQEFEDSGAVPRGG